MQKLLIVFHSATGGTEQMARAAAEGAGREPSVAVSLRQASETGAEHVLEADGFLFASPENLAAMSGLMKDFFDRTYYAALEQVVGRPYGILVCAGSDGSHAVRQIERIATGWRLRRVAEPLIVCTRAQSPDDILRPKAIAAEGLAQCAELGATLSAGIALGIF